MDETNSPEGDGEDKGADGQYETACYLGQIQLHDVVSLCLLFLLLFVPRLDMTHSQMLGKVEYGLPAKI